MRLEKCKDCPKYVNGICAKSGRPIARINGCSFSVSGMKFCRSKSGAEAFRRELGKKKGS